MSRPDVKVKFSSTVDLNMSLKGREQRNLNFRREENNVVEWAWITKEFCLRLIISSCKNTKGEARLTRDAGSRQLHSQVC